jgi:NDP-sugar pyrophosphorylase family protein
MQCVILAGGLATRLRPLTETIPKALVPVAGTPFADHQLAWLASERVSDVVYAVGYLGEAIKEFVGDGARWGLRVAYSDDGPELRGTAGALRLAHDRGLLEPRFAILYGDSYLTVPVTQAWDAFASAGTAALMTVYRNENDHEPSNVVLDGGLVVRYEKGVEDPPSVGMHYIDYGFSIVDRDAVLALIPVDAFADLASVFATFSAERRLSGFEVFDRFYEVGSPAGLQELDTLLSHGPNAAG